MFKVLIADDDFEDRELLKLEIQRALKGDDPDLRFQEAVSVREARGAGLSSVLSSQGYF